MPLLIDGYNLLHASGVFAKGRGAHTLEQARLALLVFLSDAILDDQRRVTTIVFDAKDAPPGLPRQETFRGIKVFFAARHAEADDLIEELIRAETSPRQLTVVSSDHRLQRAARRRKATAIDSDRWYADILWEVQQREQDSERDVAKPSLPLSEAEVEMWLRKFDDVEIPLEGPDLSGQREFPTEDEESRGATDSQDVAGTWNPFPSGYAEDLLNEEDDKNSDQQSSD